MRDFDVVRRTNRRQTLRAGVLLICTGLFLTGSTVEVTAASSLGAAQRGARAALRSFSNGVIKGQTVDDLARNLRTESAALKASRFADDLRSSDRKVLASITKTLRYVDEIAVAQKQADDELMVAFVESGRIADSSVRKPVNPTFRSDLADATNDAIKDVACANASNLLSSSDQEHLGVKPERVPLLQQVADATLNNLVKRRYTPAALNEFIAWPTWFSGVTKAARKLAASAPAGTLETPGHYQFGSWTGPHLHPRAYYYYFRICHAPPGA